MNKHDWPQCKVSAARQVQSTNMAGLNVLYLPPDKYCQQTWMASMHCICYQTSTVNKHGWPQCTVSATRQVQSTIMTDLNGLYLLPDKYSQQTWLASMHCICYQTSTVNQHGWPQCKVSAARQVQSTNMAGLNVLHLPPDKYCQQTWLTSMHCICYQTSTVNKHGWPQCTVSATRQLQSTNMAGLNVLYLLQDKYSQPTWLASMHCICHQTSIVNQNGWSQCKVSAARQVLSTNMAGHNVRYLLPDKYSKQTWLVSM